MHLFFTFVFLSITFFYDYTLAQSSTTQTSKIQTERPGFGDSTTLVPNDFLQIESGYTFNFESSSQDDFSGHSFPNFLVRTRLLSEFELRFGWGGNEWNDPGKDRALDVSFGLKTVLLAFDNFRIASIFDVIIPTGSSENNNKDITPDLRFVFSYDLNSNYSLGSNVNLQLPRTEDGHELEGATSLALSRSISDQVSTFIEYFVQYQGDSPAHSADTGITYLLNDNIQLDLTFGFGLNEQSDDFFTVVGASVRL